MERKFFVIGNWKMNGSVAKAKDLVSILNNIEVPPNTEVVVAPPAIYIDRLRQSLKKEIKIASQNAYIKASGAYTGELSPQMLKDIGAEWVIVGHPERRGHFNESDSFVSEKAGFALDSGLSIVICIGENLAQREAGLASDIVAHQLQSFSEKIEDWTNVVIAYEPLWTVGTGKAATPDQAQDILQHIRKWLKEKVSEETSQKTRILYCGSVNGTNCKQFAEKPDIDGFLVGVACLNPEFSDIVRARQQECPPNLTRKRLSRQCRSQQYDNQHIHKKKRV